MIHITVSLKCKISSIVCYGYVTRSTIATFIFQNIQLKLRAYILKSNKINTKFFGFVIR